MNPARFLLAGMLPLLLSACTADDSAPTAAVKSQISLKLPASRPPGEPASIKRWYGFEHVSIGGEVFQENCAVCHGKAGEGAPNWKSFGSDSKLPAPPLNGTGHAWHHPLKILLHVVKNGSPGGQGNMPAWGGKLSDAEILAAIAWFQSQWPDPLYAAWRQREGAVASRRGD